MGHASVTTTEIYLHRDVTELAGNQDRVPDLEPPEADHDPAGGKAATTRPRPEFATADRLPLSRRQPDMAGGNAPVSEFRPWLADSSTSIRQQSDGL